MGLPGGPALPASCWATSSAGDTEGKVEEGEGAPSLRSGAVLLRRLRWGHRLGLQPEVGREALQFQWKDHPL